MSNFNIGDTIRCIDTTGYVGALTINKTYVVKNTYISAAGFNCVILFDDTGLAHNCLSERFILDAVATLPVIATKSNIINSPIVNDYVCKTCANDRCSKTEKSCWRCGELIKP